MYVLHVKIKKNSYSYNLKIGFGFIQKILYTLYNITKKTSRDINGQFVPRYNTSSDARGCVFHEVVKIKSDLNQPS